MHQNRKNPIRNTQGFSMILVLCLGALFVALALALVFAASVLSANANRQLTEQKVYQMAASFSDVLQQELLSDQDSEFKTFAGKTFLEAYYNWDKDYTYEASLTQKSKDAGGADSLTITLCKRYDSDNVDVPDNTNIAVYEEDLGTLSTNDLTQNIRLREAEDHTINAFYLDVTVTAEKDGETFSYTETYVQEAHYTPYYTIGSNTTQYVYDADKIALKVQNTSDEKPLTAITESVNVYYSIQASNIADGTMKFKLADEGGTA